VHSTVATCFAGAAPEDGCAPLNRYGGEDGRTQGEYARFGMPINDVTINIGFMVGGVADAIMIAVAPGVVALRPRDFSQERPDARNSHY